MQLRAFFRNPGQWLFNSPDQSLEQAYEAALAIKKLEDDYFDGQSICPENSEYGDSAYRYIQGEVERNIVVIRQRMEVFEASRSSLSPGRQMEVQSYDDQQDEYTLDLIDQSAIIFKKLRFIDEILERYNNLSSAPAAINTPGQLNAPQTNTKNGNGKSAKNRAGLAARSSVLPRSILRTVDRVKQDLDPKAEADVMRSFRKSQGKTKLALRFVLLLVIVPLLTQQLTKHFIVGPVVDYARETTEAEVFLNDEMEEEALHELQQFEERLRFEVILGKVAALSETQLEERVLDKALDIEEEYRERSADSVKNVFADIFAVLAFSILLSTCKRQVATLKAFIDEIVYGLSDSAKAFIIILFTDIFVGFHSPHGWEVLLEGMSRHLGFPANRDFIFLFIATFPVILDTVFKYWIFRYLNRISPSAVATYKNMNE
ncbi:envelope membrane protein [Leptolyngbya sp. Heron Island J]|uniref:proton extrusion protein PcxA n=1 Tax=Leptolyngbya sp. Heron Island J TaxID=1385935 RepID=UPI0003B9A9DA|nr:proton extrusion protein PcxA [Leptolyngbya sp. Heron Island J]ESA32276.1 envelope membrane protein [Leptolyngbya sp. Heron Island J]